MRPSNARRHGPAFLLDMKWRLRGFFELFFWCFPAVSGTCFVSSQKTSFFGTNGSTLHFDEKRKIPLCAESTETPFGSARRKRSAWHHKMCAETSETARRALSCFQSQQGTDSLETKVRKTKKHKDQNTNTTLDANDEKNNVFVVLEIS